MWIFSAVLYFCRSPVCCEQHLLSLFSNSSYSDNNFHVEAILVPEAFLVITFGTAKAGSCWVGYENSPGAAFKGGVSVAWCSGSSAWFLLLCGRNSCCCSTSDCCFVGKGSNSVWVGLFPFLFLSFRSPFVSKSSNSAAQQRKTSQPCPQCVGPAPPPWPLLGCHLWPTNKVCEHVRNALFWLGHGCCRAWLHMLASVG